MGDVGLNDMPFFNISLYLIIFVHNVPFLVVALSIFPDWLNFSANTIISTIFYVAYMTFYGVKFDKRDFFIKSMGVHAIMVTIFALKEKIRKELYVIGLTNARTKR